MVWRVSSALYNYEDWQPIQALRFGVPNLRSVYKLAMPGYMSCLRTFQNDTGGGRENRAQVLVTYNPMAITTGNLVITIRTRTHHVWLSLNQLFFLSPLWMLTFLSPRLQERYCFRVGLLQVCSLAWFLCVCLITCRIKNSTSMLIGSVCPFVCLFVCLLAL